MANKYEGTQTEKNLCEDMVLFVRYRNAQQAQQHKGSTGNGKNDTRKGRKCEPHICYIRQENAVRSVQKYGEYQKDDSSQSFSNAAFNFLHNITLST